MSQRQRASNRVSGSDYQLHSVTSTKGWFAMDNFKSHLSRRQFLRYAAGLGLSASAGALLQGCGTTPPGPTPSPTGLQKQCPISFFRDFVMDAASLSIAGLPASF